MSFIHINDSVHWYMNDLTSRIVAESGNLTDRFHIGKLVFRSFKDNPDDIAQIDGITGTTESHGSLLKRSIQCAIAFRKLGLQRGDVMVLMAPNHLDLAVPFYAALYLGIVIAPVDRTFQLTEIEHTFSKYKPKILFCQRQKVPEILKALQVLDRQKNVTIIVFDEASDVEYMSFEGLLTADDEAVRNFKPDDFNAEDSIGFLVPTSGSTGPPKGAAITYKAWMITGPYLWARCTKFPTPTRMVLILAPLQWLTTIIHFVITPFIRYTRLQTSSNVTVEHVRYLINTYKPTFAAFSTTMMSHLLKFDDQEACDVSCFECVMIGGSAVHKGVIEDFKKVSPKAIVTIVYGMSELTTMAFQGEVPPGSCGKPIGLYQYRLIDVDKKEDIEQPNVPGELWIKGPGMFKEYYNDEQSTREAFADNGWYKTGDMLYRDENWNFFFVERLKSLLKYNCYQISPVEIESVISRHPAVLDVAVTGLEDPAGDLPVACIVPRSGHSPTAQEIKDLVKENLSDAKQLKGGVVFMKELPMLASTKIDRRKLKKMVQELALQ